MRSLLVLLPAYNEGPSLETQLRKIVDVAAGLEVELRIIVGNDGSRDDTGDVVARLRDELPVEELRHTINRGLGETSRDLFERAAELADDDDVIVRMDADDTHEPKHIVQLIEKLDEGHDVVIASRFQPGGGQLGVTGYRAFISRCANVFMGVFLHVPGVRDYSCGYRAYRGAIIKRAIDAYGNDFVQLKGLGFTCTLEKLIKLKLLGASFAEVPFVHRYDQKVSASKMIASVTMLGYLVMALLYHWPWGGWRRQYRSLRRPAVAARPDRAPRPQPAALQR